jgi:Zn-dependent peptidase ImmA (M78 family)
MGYPRGFKTEANQTAEEIRAELGLGPLDRLDPRRLAEVLHIPIFNLTAMVELDASVGHFVNVEPDAFSAVTVFSGTRRGIVHNDTHSTERQNSNLAHELAHGLLLHPPTAALEDTGCRNWNQDFEDEATWLAGVLLVTEAATIDIARNRIPVRDASAQYEVSEQMIRWRMNMTGAVRRVSKHAGSR